MNAKGTNRPLASERDPIKFSESRAYLRQLPEIVERLPYDAIDAVTDVFEEAYRANRTLFIFGNGGSAALASHVACDLGKGTCVNGNRRFRVLSVTDNVPLMTAWANDQNYDDIFAEQLRAFVQPRDVVLAISGSGNSPNVLNGLETAKRAGAITVGFSGFQGGRMKVLCDHCVVISSENMQLIEDLHVAVAHAIFTALHGRLTAERASTAARQL